MIHICIYRKTTFHKHFFKMLILTFLFETLQIIHDIWVFICRYLSIFVDLCRYVDICQYLSIFFDISLDICRYLSIFVNICWSLSIFVNICWSLSIFVDIGRYLSIFVDIYRYLSISVGHRSVNHVCFHSKTSWCKSFLKIWQVHSYFFHFISFKNSIQRGRDGGTWYFERVPASRGLK